MDVLLYLLCVIPTYRQQFLPHWLRRARMPNRFSQLQALLPLSRILGKQALNPVDRRMRGSRLRPSRRWRAVPPAPHVRTTSRLERVWEVDVSGCSHTCLERIKSGNMEEYKERARWSGEDRATEKEAREKETERVYYLSFSRQSRFQVRSRATWRNTKSE